MATKEEKEEAEDEQVRRGTIEPEKKIKNGEEERDVTRKPLSEHKFERSKLHQDPDPAVQ